MKILHVTHNDADAVGCAVLVALRYRHDSITTHFCAIGTQDQIITDEIVKMNTHLDELKTKGYSGEEATTCCYDKIIVSDLSILPETYHLIQEEITYLKDKYDFDLDFSGYDHHITNTIYEIADDFIVAAERFDNVANKVIPISATRLMYDMYISYIDTMPDKSDQEKHEQLDAELKHFCNSISRYDTWVWKRDLDTVEIQNKDFLLTVSNILKADTPIIFDDDFYTVLCKKYGPNDLYHMILNNIASAASYGTSSWIYPKEFAMVYNLEKEVETKITEKAVKEVKFLVDGEYIVGMYLPDGEFINTVTDALYDKYPFVDYWVILKPAHKEIGFRSDKEDLNLGRLAKRVYGGGGHKQASGAKNIDSATFLHLLKIFYEQTLPADEIPTNTPEDMYKFINNKMDLKKLKETIKDVKDVKYDFGGNDE